jgi:uncharacterized membrane protein YgcG
MKPQAYDPDWAFHTALRSQAARWQRQQLLDAAQLAAVEAAYPLDYYRPVWPLRVGLFLFTWLGLAMAGGLAFLLTDYSPFAGGLLYAATCFGVLHLVIKERRFYHCGADNALLYAGLGTVGSLIFYIFSEFVWESHYYSHFSLANGYFAVPLLLVLLLLVAAAFRYADALVTAAAFATLLQLVTLAGMQSAWGQALLPFLIMGTAVGVLALYRTLALRLAGTSLADYYASCLLMLKVLALAVLYLGGNYLVVREGNAELRHASVSEQIPFALIFYILTASIPILYITLGLRRADRPLLLMGLLTLAFSLFTLRYYRSVLPPEIAAVAAGTFLTVAAGALLRALRPAHFGFTSLPDDEPRYFNLENLIQAQTAYTPTPGGAPATGGFEFGGGQSGGGGATGQF